MGGQGGAGEQCSGERGGETDRGKLPGAGISNPEVQLGSLGSCFPVCL